MIDYTEYAREYMGVELRPAQRFLLPAVDRLLAQNRILMLEAPTGIGKSLIPLTIAHANTDLYFIIVTPTTYLQHQYANDLRRWFTPGEYSVMMGRRNYPCPFLREKYNDLRDFTADYCPSIIEFGFRCPYNYKISHHALYDLKERRELIKTKQEFTIFPGFVAWFEEGQQRCPYALARMRAARSRIVVTNYDYFFLDFFLSHYLHFPHIVVFDEAHVLLEKLYSRFTFLINFSDPVFEEFGIDVSPIYEVGRITSDTYFFAISDIVKRLESVLSDEDMVSKAISDIDTAYRLHRLRNYYTSLSFIARLPMVYRGRIKLKGDLLVAVASPTILMRVFTREFFTARPLVFSSEGGELYFYSHPSERRILIMSATLGERRIWHPVFGEWRYYLFTNIRSPFDVQRRYVYYPMYPQGSDVSFSGYNLTPNEELLKFAVNQIIRGFLLLRRYSSRAGIVVHAYLRSLASDVYSALLEELGDYDVNIYLASSDAIDPDTDESLRTIVNQFVETGGILISTVAVMEGVDLRDERARLQYILKAPYPRYTAEDRDFVVARRVVQMAGRVVRSKSDFGYTIVLDSALRRHLMVASAHYPRYYLKAVRLDLTLDEVYKDIEENFRRYYHAGANTQN